jgi:hypothetical protein
MKLKLSKTEEKNLFYLLFRHLVPILYVGK